MEPCLFTHAHTTWPPMTSQALSLKEMPDGFAASTGPDFERWVKSGTAAFPYLAAALGSFMEAGAEHEAGSLHQPGPGLDASAAPAVPGLAAAGGAGPEEVAAVAAAMVVAGGVPMPQAGNPGGVNVSMGAPVAVASVPAMRSKAKGSAARHS